MAARIARLSVLLVVVALTSAACGAVRGAPGWTIAPIVNPAPAAPAAPVIATAGPVAPTATSEPPAPTAAVPAPSPAALGFTPGTKASPRVVEMTVDDNLNFVPGFITVADGETVTFALTNVGKAEHEFMVGPAANVLADKEGTPEVAGIKPGTTVTLSYTFTGPGPFRFACHAPGHFEHGMQGWIQVVGAGVPAVGTASSPRLVHIDMSDQLKFDPDNIQVAAGETITFVLTNSGEAVHEFQVGPADQVAADAVDGKSNVEIDSLDGGSTNALTYTFSGPGPYAFGCHEPGHYENGMMGTITIGTAPTAAIPAPSPAEAAPAAAGIAGTIDITAVDLAFEPQMVMLPGPGAYIVSFTNNGSIGHDMTFDDGTKIAAGPGTTATGTVQIPVGGLNFICSIPGHAEAGMSGMVMVDQAAAAAAPAP
jgi:uncharacterized cupredoxin-like copper-binding protein